MTHALSTLQPPSRVLTDNDVSRRGHRGSRRAHLNMFARAPPGPLRLRGSSWSGRPHPRPRRLFAGDGSMVESVNQADPHLGERYCNRNKLLRDGTLYGTFLEPQTTNIEIGTNAPRDTTRTGLSRTRTTRERRSWRRWAQTDTKPSRVIRITGCSSVLYAICEGGTPRMASASVALGTFCGQRALSSASASVARAVSAQSRWTAATR